MAYGAFAETKSRYRDLDLLLDYREYDGEWTAWFEENWLKPRLKALGYPHVRFFGGKTCEYDGSFRGARLRTGKARWHTSRVLRVRLSDVVPQQRDGAAQRAEQMIPTNQVKESSRCT